MSETKLKPSSTDAESDSCASSSTGRESSGDKKRGNWAGRLDFLLSLIGYAVGLGNIWRFPYLCYRNGGAAFLIPYLIFLVLCGMPLFFLEVSYGQFASLSPIAVWRVSPLFKGIGIGMVIISGIVCIYYNVIMAWTLYYLFKSFQRVLPWSTCNNEWNTDACAARTGAIVGGNMTADFNSSVLTSIFKNETVEAIHEKITPSEEFWQRNVLEITEGINDFGSIRWELFGCLAAAWVVVFFCLCKGVQSSGRVVYVTATFPYVCLFILLIRGVTLPGASEGIKFYLLPKWERLLTFQIWYEAAMQIFYSLGPAWGGLITMSSYSKFNNNCYRDARIVPVLNSCTSIFAGFVTFSIIGFMAHETGAKVEDVVTQGPGLVFVIYPEAVAKMPISPLWAVLFFLMLFTVGLDTQFGMFETLTSALMDGSHMMRAHKTKLVAVICVFEFLLGIPCVTQGGVYFLQIMDWYSSTFALMILSLLECVVLAWIYGAERLYKDIELMIGFRPCIWWKITWCFITPALLVFVLLTSMIQHTPVTYGDYEYPGWAIGLGWIFATVSLVPLPVMAIIGILQTKGTLIERVVRLVQPTAEWGPADEEHRQLYLATLKGQDVTPDDLEDVVKLSPEKCSLDIEI